MKSEKDKQEALALYTNNLSLEKIAKDVGVTITTIKKWRKSENWEEQRAETIRKVAEKLPEINSQIILDQIEVTGLVDKELLKRLKNQEKIRIQIQELLSYLRQLNIKEDKDEYFATVNSIQGLSKEIFQNKDLIAWGKHGLELVRPKTTNQLNLTQEVNKGIIYKFEVDRARSKDKVITETT